MQKTPERRLPGVGTQLLVGRRNRDGLLARFEFDCLGHRLVSRSLVAFSLRFLHRINYSQTVAPFPTASLRLRCLRFRKGKSPTGRRVTTDRILVFAAGYGASELF